MKHPTRVEHDNLHLREVIISSHCPPSIADVAEAVVNPPLDVNIVKARASYERFDIRQRTAVSTHTTKGFRAALAIARDIYYHELPDEDEGTKSLG